MYLVKREKLYLFQVTSINAKTVNIQRWKSTLDQMRLVIAANPRSTTQQIDRFYEKATCLIVMFLAKNGNAATHWVERMAEALTKQDLRTDATPKQVRRLADIITPHLVYSNSSCASLMGNFADRYQKIILPCAI